MRPSSFIISVLKCDGAISVAFSLSLYFRNLVALFTSLESVFIQK